MSIFYKPHCEECKDVAPIARWRCPNWIKETIALHSQECADWEARAIAEEKRHSAVMREIWNEAQAVYADQRVWPCFEGLDWEGNTAVQIQSTALDDKISKQEEKAERLTKTNKRRQNKRELQIYELKSKLG